MKKVFSSNMNGSNTMRNKGEGLKYTLVNGRCYRRFQNEQDTVYCEIDNILLETNSPQEICESDTLQGLDAINILSRNEEDYRFRSVTSIMLSTTAFYEFDKDILEFTLSNGITVLSALQHSDIFLLGVRPFVIPTSPDFPPLDGLMLIVKNMKPTGKAYKNKFRSTKKGVKVTLNEDFLYLFNLKKDLIWNEAFNKAFGKEYESELARLIAEGKDNKEAQAIARDIAEQRATYIAETVLFDYIDKNR